MTRRIELFNCLQGLISLYKPPGISSTLFKRRVVKTIVNEFNDLPWETERIRTLVIPPSDEKSTPAIVDTIDIVDNPLVIGKRFLPFDLVLNPIHPLFDYASGVQVFGIGELGAHAYANQLYQSQALKSYHLVGMFGKASSNGLNTGSIIYRTSWRHITRTKLDRTLAAFEFKARKASLLHAGLVPNTQKAYNMLSKSDRLPSQPPAILRPMVDPIETLPPTQIAPYWDRVPDSNQSVFLRAKPDPSSVGQIPPSIHAIMCTEFEPPFFTIELQVSNETETFFTDLMVNIGAYLRSACLLTKVRRIRHGLFTARDSLLLKHCTLPPAVYARFLQLRDRSLSDEVTMTDEVDETQYRENLIAGALEVEPKIPNLLSNLLVCTRLHRARPSFLHPNGNKKI